MLIRVKKIAKTSENDDNKSKWQQQVKTTTISQNEVTTETHSLDRIARGQKNVIIKNFDEYWTGKVERITFKMFHLDLKVYSTEWLRR